MRRSLIFSSVIAILLFILFSPIIFHLTNYLHPIVMGTILFCLWSVITFLILLIRKETITIHYSTFLSLLIIYTLMLFVLLFFRPSDQNYHSYNLIPFSTIYFFLSGKVNYLISFYNLAANILLFVPYGIFLKIKMLKTSILGYISIPLVAISIIEILQFMTHRGSLDIDDLILNMLGFLLGYLCYPLFSRVILFAKDAKQQ